MNQETKILGIIGVVTAILVVGAVFFLSKESKPKPADTSLLIRENSNKISTDSGKLTIVEFGDYECPACGAVYPGLKQVLSEYSGKVNFVYRHFPLMQHKSAEIAAAAAEASGMQGKYWDMHNMLYERQDEWDEGADALGFFRKYATEIGLDVEKFVSDMGSEQAKQKVRNDLTDGLALGINSTPSFFFDGELYKKGFSYNDFKTEIESRLK